MCDDNVQISSRGIGDPLDRFFSSYGNGALSLNAQGQGAARVLFGDEEFLMEHLVDPVLLRERLSGSDVGLGEYRMVSCDADLDCVSELKPPFVFRCGAETRFVRYGADAVLPYSQLASETDSTSMVLEHGVRGQGIWALGFVEERRFRLHGFVDLEWLDDIYLFPMALNFPAALDEAAAKDLSSLCGRVVEALDLEDGPIRIEFCYDDLSNGYEVAEVDTGWFSNAMPVDLPGLSGCGSYWENHLRLMRGESVVLPGECERAVAVQWLYSRSGIVEEILGAEEVLEMDGVSFVELNVSVGERLGHVLDRRSRDRLGFVVGVGERVTDARALAAAARKRIEIVRKTIL